MILKSGFLAVALASIMLINTDLASAQSGPAASSKGPPTTEPVPVLVSWIKCSTEGGTCLYPAGTQNVRYGANNKYFTKSIANGAAGNIGCQNQVWSDPIHGILKTCDYTMTKR